MKKLVLVFFVLLVSAAGFWSIGGGMFTDATSSENEEPQTAIVGRRDLGATVLATGVIRPQVGAEVQVGSRVSGILQRLHVTVGDRVEAGQLLAELDDTEFRARENQAAAQLETAVVERDFAAAELDRARQLRSQEVITQAEFDAAERMHNMAVAQVRESEATLESAEIQLGYTKIRAPIAGVVASVTTQVGETVAASFAAPTFVTIIDLDRLEVWAYVDETDIGRVEVGQPARFTVDTYAGVEFSAKVSAIQPKAEILDNVVNYVTILDIGDRQGRTLRPEMTTTVNIVIEGRHDVVAIPNGAVRRDENGVFVYLPGSDRPTRRGIEVGYRGRNFTEVVQGLDVDEIVILGAVEELR